MKFHKLKTIIFKTLDILPSSWGYFLYHKIQQRGFKAIDQKIKANERSHKILQSIIRDADITLKDTNVVEIGSGWLPLMPYLLAINDGVKKIKTFDINEHYQPELIKKVDHHYNANNTLNLEYHKKNGYHLPTFIEYFPKCDIKDTLIKEPVALYFSRFVLEHIPPQVIADIHKKIYNEMKPGSHILHLISPSDHRAYGGSPLSYYDFLQYSQKEWDSIQTKFDYHNRLRLPQYVAIFEKIGFEIKHVDFETAKEGTDKFKKYKDLKLDAAFKDFTDDENTAGAINVLLMKPN